MDRLDVSVRHIKNVGILRELNRLRKENKIISKNRYINTKIYSDPYVRKLESDEKLLFLYFLTNHLTNISGMYEITEEQIVFDTRISLEKIDSILSRFKKDKKILYIDHWIFVINFIKNQKLNPSVIIGIEREVKSVPAKIRKQFISACKILKSDGTINSDELDSDKPKPKPTYDGYPMAYKKKEDKWYVIHGKGDWRDFAGDIKKDIVWQ